MSASQVMDPHPVTVKPTDSIKTVVTLIMEHRYRSLPVVDDQGCFLGTVGVNCLLKLVLPRSAVMGKGLESLSFVHDSLKDLQLRLSEQSNQQVEVCMNTDSPVVAPDTSLLETLLTLYRSKSSIPVVEPETGKLIGMISYFDVGEAILNA